MMEPTNHYVGPEALERYPEGTEVTVLFSAPGQLLTVPGNPGKPNIPICFVAPTDADAYTGDQQISCTMEQVPIGRLYDDFEGVYLLEKEGVGWHNVFLQPNVIPAGPSDASPA